MNLIKKTAKDAVFTLTFFAAASAFIEWKKMPLSILIGGALCLANIKGLAWGVQGILGSGKATGRMIFFSMFRLLALFIILSLLVYLKLVNIFGILTGLTIVFVLLMIEGLRISRHPADGDHS
jgi:hypothetical protein